MRVNLTITDGPAAGLTRIYESPDWFLLGRAPDTHFQIPGDEFLSGQHFMMRIGAGTCDLIELNSKNGVIVNGIRYGGRRPPPREMRCLPNVRLVEIPDGSVIEVGVTRILVSLEHAGGRASAAAATQTLPSVGSPPVDRGASPVAPQRAPIAPTLTALPVASAGTPSPGLLPDFFPGYRLVSELGRGGMGIVYKAVQSATGRTVALKAMRPDTALSQQCRLMFQREMDVTAQLHHDNLVEVYGHGAERESLFLAMGFVDGCDLASLIKEHPNGMPLHQAAPIMLDVLAGLGYAHRAPLVIGLGDGRQSTFTGTVHRDIKPQNILLGKRPNGWAVKVSDFGLGKSFEAAGLTDMTKNGTFAGTPLYWPREQLTHYRYLAPSSDVFSAAAVFYEMLSGRPMRTALVELFERHSKTGTSPDMAQVFTAILGEAAAPLRQSAPAIPAGVAAVIDRALREEAIANDERILRASLASLRYPDANHFREALAAALKAEGVRM